MKPTFFSARCGTFSSAQNAQNMASDLQRQGFPASVRFEAPDGKPLHIVLVGKFGTFEAASQQVAALRSIVPDVTVWP
jgi:cell division septation protein DedD